MARHRFNVTTISAQGAVFKLSRLSYNTSAPLHTAARWLLEMNYGKPEDVVEIFLNDNFYMSGRIDQTLSRDEIASWREGYCIWAASCLGIKSSGDRRHRTTSGNDMSNRLLERPALGGVAQ